MNQNYNFIKNKNIIDNKSNEINPFKGLPAYFVRKGKKQIIKKYFKLFFFRILQDSLIKKDKEENFINLSDLFFKIYWNTLPFFELKLLPKYKNNLYYEFIKILKPRFKKKKKISIKKNLIGFSTISRNKENEPIISINMEYKSNFIIPLKQQIQDKLRKRWTFQYIKSVKKNNKLLTILYNVFQKDLINSDNQITKEINVGARYFKKEFYWTLNNFRFFQDKYIKSYLLFHIMPREYKLTYKDLKLFRKNNKKFIQYNLKKFFFNRLLNKYLNISANNYFLKPNELNYYINSNFLEREIDKINIERKINLFKVSKILIKNNLQKRFFNTITEDTNVLNSNKKNDGNNFFLTEVNKEEVKFKNKENICIRLVFKSFDKKSLEYSKSLLLKLFLKKKNIKISIINLPTNKTKYTILKSPHIDKRSRDQFEKVIYKSLINFIIPEYIFNKEFINFFLYLIKKISPTIYIQYIIIKN